MKKIAGITLITCFGFFIIGCQTNSKEYSIKQLNDSIFEINFASFKAKVDINASGRVVSYSLDDLETLAGLREHPFNYGSTLWPAPQSEWNWPPPSDLDGEPYNISDRKEKLGLNSKVCTSTGLQFSKQFYFNVEDSSFVLDYTITNKKAEPRHAEAWEVTRVKGNISFFPLYKDSIYEISNLMSAQNIDGVYWYEHNWDSLPKSQKVYADATEGWLAHITRDNLLFIKKFDDIPLKSQAPGQGEVEIYASSDHDYIELENHGKNTLLQPGEELKYKVKWYLTRIPADIPVEAGNQELLNFTRHFILTKNNSEL